MAPLSRPFCPYNSRWVCLGYFSAVGRYTAASCCPTSHADCLWGAAAGRQLVRAEPLAGIGLNDRGGWEGAIDMHSMAC